MEVSEVTNYLHKCVTFPHLSVEWGRALLQSTPRAKAGIGHWNDKLEVKHVTLMVLPACAGKRASLVDRGCEYVDPYPKDSLSTYGRTTAAGLKKLMRGDKDTRNADVVVIVQDLHHQNLESIVINPCQVSPAYGWPLLQGSHTI